MVTRAYEGIRSYEGSRETRGGLRFNRGFAIIGAAGRWYIQGKTSLAIIKISINKSRVL